MVFRLRRVLGARLFALLVFALVIVLIQMLALSKLTAVPPSSGPWEHNSRELKLHKETETQWARVIEDPVTTSPKPVKPPSKLQWITTAKLEHTQSPTASTVKNKKPVTARPVQSLTPHPLPAQLSEDCQSILDSKKDASSAFNRAKTDECRTLIRNVTCLQHHGLLYNQDIHNECPMGKFSGHEFKYLPYSLGEGEAVRIVFLLSLHGRAVRQVKRLLKAIYHSDHYFFIHVDSRSDYLHRQLYEELSDLPNVYFPSWRLATIWGGASLLQMLLRAMEDLEFVLSDWNWDYLINLSESDYPLKTNDELTKFLRVHRGKNFVKTHGGDYKKFIQKQGLDRTFVECDSHMWRVDTRPLPEDIVIDGGSDWIAIHRNYSRYLVTDSGKFLTELKKYYEFSLLPAESFFHTVLHNGPMCESFVRTNLRVTNWNRKLGCRCQYKHIVDWCGCSPNDFLAKDFNRLKTVGDHHFFARKFEAIVNQEVILALDTHLYGALPDDYPSLYSHWESVFHIDDDITSPSNARYSTYQSFLRQSVKLLYNEQAVKGSGGECGIPKQAAVKEVHVLRERDEFKGLVVTIKDVLDDSLSPPEFEVLLSPVPHSERVEESGDAARRIKSLHVGSEWDGKESIFRNYPGIVGAWDEPVASLSLSPGKQVTVHIIWEDPIGFRVANFPMKLEAAWYVTYHKPKIDTPIRPGLWTVRLETPEGVLLMRNTFLVVPLTHHNKVVLNEPQAVNARHTATVKPVPDRAVYEQWKSNVLKSGTELEEWMDSLVTQFWTIESYCRTAAGEDLCTWVQDCSTTSWSTFTPDPKSEIGEVKTNGRIR